MPRGAPSAAAVLADQSFDIAGRGAQTRGIGQPIEPAVGAAAELDARPSSRDRWWRSWAWRRGPNSATQRVRRARRQPFRTSRGGTTDRPPGGCSNCRAAAARARPWAAPADWRDSRDRPPSARALSSSRAGMKVSDFGGTSGWRARNSSASSAQSRRIADADEPAQTSRPFRDRQRRCAGSIHQAINSATQQSASGIAGGADIGRHARQRAVAG